MAKNNYNVLMADNGGRTSSLNIVKGNANKPVTNQNTNQSTNQNTIQNTAQTPVVEPPKAETPKVETPAENPYKPNGFNTRQQMTDTGTGSYGKDLTVEENNGVIHTKNNVTGTEFYGKRDSSGNVSYDPTPEVQQQNESLYKQVLEEQSDAKKGSSGTNGTNGSSGAGSEGGSEGGSEEGSKTDDSQSKIDDFIEQLKKWMEESKNKADARAKSDYENLLLQNNNAADASRRAANLQYMRTRGMLRNMFGDQISGPNITNQYRNAQNWNSNLANIQRDLTQNNNSAFSNYQKALESNEDKRQQGWLNTILPIYTNRQQNEDDLNYRKYIAQLFGL